MEPNTEKTNYELYRGKCFEMSSALVAENPTFRLVRGHYICPYWGKQEHWWTVDDKGDIHDPTELQFPSQGHGEYVEYDGTCECEQCHKTFREEDGHKIEPFICCSYRCACRLVGL